MKKKCYLVLATGEAFEGERFGAEANALGELVFNTGSVGYIQTLTDPSYYGQIVMQTFPLIGDYGMISAEQESEKCNLKGYVVREWCDAPSNFRSEGDIDAWLKAQNVPGIAGVDTRQLTRLIRDKGVMNAMIVDSPEQADMALMGEYRVIKAVPSVSARERAVWPAENEKCRVALLDYGAKHNIIRELNARGATVIVLPYDATVEDVMASSPDALMLSNGPGDPAENRECVEMLKRMVGKLPTFGICLGHQLMALAAGAETFKLKYGHRGSNQPVKRVSDGQMYITSQNHGYAVAPDTLPQGAFVTYVNANDGTCEGIAYPELQAFSVQFHPEACSGPKDTAFLFDMFLAMIGGERHAQK